MDDSVKKFILRHKDLIAKHNYEQLYIEVIYASIDISRLSEVLVAAGINPLPYFDGNTFYSTFNGLDISNICRNRILEIPKNIVEVAYSSFSDASGFDEVRFPDTLRNIDDHAFQGSEITSLNIPGSVKHISEGAFSNCISLEQVILNEGTEILETQCFAYCQNLKQIIFPTSLRTIESNVINGWAVEVLKFSGNMRYISGNGNFKNLHNLKEIYIDSNFDSFQPILMSLPSGVKVIFNDKTMMSDNLI